MRGYLVIVGPLLYHARPESVPGGPDIVPGGILSIDLFFVMSSYLIVSIALREWSVMGRIDLIAYGGRRVRRLLPALLVLLGFLAVYLALIDAPELVDRWTGAIVSALTYSANWHEIASGVSYFESFGPPSPLRHVWSFSIEEQFYVFAPLFLIAGLSWGRARGRQLLLVASLIGAVLSAWWMARVHVVGEDPSRAYFGTDTRAQALFIGIAMAVALDLYGSSPRSSRGRRLCALLAYPAMAWHLWAVLNLSERDSWLFERGGYLLVAVIGGVAMWSLSQEASWSPLHRFFALAPFIYLGRISYGVYLFHWPVYLLVTQERAGRVFGVDRLTGWSLLAFHLVLTVAIAAVSFHFLEQPFVQRRWPFTKKSMAAATGSFAAATAVIVILGGVLVAHTRRPPVVETVLIPGAAAAGVDGFGAVPAQGDAPSPLVSEVAAAGEQELRVLTVGDSVADQIGVALVSWSLANPDAGVVAFNEAHIGCGTVRYGDKRVPEGDVGPVGDLCSAWAEPVDPAAVSEYNVVSWPTVIDLFGPDVVVTYLSPWDVTDRAIPGVFDGDWTHVGEEAFDTYAASEFREAIDLLTSSGAELYILAGAPLNRPLTPQNSPERIDALNVIVADVAAEARADGRPVTMVDFAGWVGEVGSEQELQRRDDGLHLSDSGLVDVVPWLLEEVIPAGPDG
jgi:peptidoglycan/LPS O-acetylase OafA/YrhL